IKIAQQKLRHPDFSGKWFVGQPLEIASPTAAAWKIATVKKSGETSEAVVNSNKLNLFVDDAQVSKVELTLIESSAQLPSLDAPEGAQSFDVYNIAGIKMKSSVEESSVADGLEPGIYILKSPHAVKKVMVR
ncbi:MAG: hypothetical protein NC548_58125, partial [Lachnospiraceae bacterium]|nr:hypothetical protein [Lachnospiraceae bacterium]